MNRRRFLAGVGTGLATVSGGYAGVRVGDLRPFAPALPSGETPRERIVAAAAHRYAVDHRARTTVRVERDGTDDAPYESARYEERHQHSRRRHLHRFVALAVPPGVPPLPYHGLPALFHWDDVRDGRSSLPAGGLLYHTDGLVAFDYRTARPAANPKRFGTASVEATDDMPAMFGEFVRPHRASWTERDRTSETVTYELAGADAYSQVVPLYLSPTPVNDTSRIRATLDRDTGRLRQLVDRRDLSVPPERVDDERVDGYRLVYHIETTFDRYGTATATLPPGASVPLGTRFRAAMSDLGTY